jgi:hypothetical protein
MDGGQPHGSLGRDALAPARRAVPPLLVTFLVRRGCSRSYLSYLNTNWVALTSAYDESAFNATPNKFGQPPRREISG